MSRKAEIGVMVVDDNDILGQSLERWMTQVQGMRWLGWTPDAAGAERLAAERRPDVVLLDVDIPGADTFALLRRLTSGDRPARVLMLSGHVRQDYVERALDEGASGYIVKDESPASIIELVRKAMEGRVVLSATARAAMLGSV